MEIRNIGQACNKTIFGDSTGSLSLVAAPIEGTWQNRYTGKCHMMIESKDRVNVRSGMDQCKRESVHIGEFLIIIATNHLSNSSFHLGIWIYYLKEALIFHRILHSKPS